MNDIFDVTYDKAFIVIDIDDVISP